MEKRRTFIVEFRNSPYGELLLNIRRADSDNTTKVEKVDCDDNYHLFYFHQSTFYLGKILPSIVSMDIILKHWGNEYLIEGLSIHEIQPQEVIDNWNYDKHKDDVFLKLGEKYYKLSSDTNYDVTLVAVVKDAAHISEDTILHILTRLNPSARTSQCTNKDNKTKREV